MLCRVADSLFWMSRYLERADSTVRLVDINLQELMEANIFAEPEMRKYWEPILQSLGDLKLYLESYGDSFTSHEVAEFLTFDTDNPSSVINCVRAARENARMVRDQITNEMWEIINRLYLYLKNQNSRDFWSEGPVQFSATLKEYILLFDGMTESTFLQRVGYEFIKAGKFLERAEKTGRLIDIKHFIQLPEGIERSGVADIKQWSAILNAASAFDAYHQVYVSDVSRIQAIELLLFNSQFPRSMRFSLSRLQQAIHAISGCPLSHYSNEAERRCGRLVSDFSYQKLDDIESNGGLHHFLTNVQRELSAIAIELNRSYMFFPIVDPTEPASPDLDSE